MSVSNSITIQDVSQDPGTHPMGNMDQNNNNNNLYTNQHGSNRLQPSFINTIFLLKPQLNFITTTSVTRLINKSCFQKLVTSLHKTSEAAFHTLANKLLFCPYLPILLPVRQESISLVLPILV